MKLFSTVIWSAVIAVLLAIFGLVLAFVSPDWSSESLALIASGAVFAILSLRAGR